MSQKSRFLSGLVMSCCSFAALSATPVGGLYTEGFGGVIGVPNYINKNNFSDVSFQTGYHAGGLVGIKTGPFHYNLEALYAYSKPRNYTFNAVEQTATGNKSASLLGFLNIGYDFKDIIDNISPYVDVGIGVNYLATGLTSTNPSSTSYKNTFYDFSYQAKAGTTFNFSENYALTLGYRYVRGTDSDNNGHVYQGHFGELGLIYRFVHL